MKSIIDNSILFSILLFLFLIIKQRFTWIAIVFVCFYYYFKVKDHSWICLLAACFLCMIPRFEQGVPTCKEAWVSKVNESYAILQNGNTKVITYTDALLLLDGKYQLDGEFEVIEGSNGFYRFDFQEWCFQQGIYYCFNGELTLEEQPHTLHSLIQEKIAQIEDESERSILYRILLNVSTDTDKDQDWLQENGFSMTGILVIIQSILKLFMDRKKREGVMCIISLLLAYFFQFPLLVVENFIFHVFFFTKLSYRSKLGIITSLIILLYPAHILRVSFLIPTIYRYSYLFEEKQKQARFFLILIVQSIFFHTINPLRNLLYHFIQKLFGVLWLVGLVRLIFPFFTLTMITSINQLLYSFLESFDIPGSIIGSGLVFYVLLCLSMRKKKYCLSYCVILLFVFQFLGLFHPFASLTVINVGQGDSILLRGPFNSSNILIDTGKPSAFDSVDAYLEANGIRHLDGLIITHDDDDHSGNKDAIIEKYEPETVIEEHEDSYQLGIYTLYDLNKISNDDENQSSIVNVLNMNGCRICLMADVDEDSEKEIISRYSGLHCDVLKVGHHGSKTSSSNLFLDTVKPKLALISSGAYSIYHHPSPETIQKLLKRHIPYFDTKTSGDIMIMCFPFGNLVITSAFEIGFL